MISGKHGILIINAPLFCLSWCLCNPREREKRNLKIYVWTEKLESSLSVGLPEMDPVFPGFWVQ